ncbi:SDR family oxidoreductase [Dyella sp. C9]|uniref:SDR family oxidoreductase n=1 Tax=Dyella sp. C9 TaxID=2202154 RepID=UPI000DEED888|nr:SDR family oxidoreductase [Dyella sp. C9]
MQEGKTALVTGANKGIGREIARQLAEKGYTVWMGCRDAARGRTAVDALVAAGLDVRLLEIDVASDPSVTAAADALGREAGHLNVLVNNAGVPGFGTSPLEESIANIKDIYEVNVFGPIRVTQAFQHLLKAAASARIVNVSSGLGSLGLMSDPASAYSKFNNLGYNSSKTALNGVTVAFANAFRSSGIKVNAADPGYVATDLNGHSGPRTVAQGATPVVRLATLDESGPTGQFFEEFGAQAW